MRHESAVWRACAPAAYQLDVIDYLQEENRALKERLGRRRIVFTDAERRRLAREACPLGRKVLNESVPRSAVVG